MITQDQQAVALDGEAVRHIREQKRLTQLYVSKVIGVTTDTVSRWENNRYPTIRRENALKLAEALEVELDAILKREEEQTAPVVMPSAPPSIARRPLVLLASAVTVLVLVIVWAFLDQDQPLTSLNLQAERVMPTHAAPGSQLLIQLRIQTPTELPGMIVKEILPPGTRLVASQPEAASVDEDRGIARWIFRQPSSSLQLFYRLEVDAQLATGTLLPFNGEVIVNPDGRQFVQTISSSSDLRVRPLHWVDLNANQIIDDLEILIFSEVTENTSLVDDQWQLLEELWHAGAYRWQEETGTFRPDPDQALNQ